MSDADALLGVVGAGDTEGCLPLWVHGLMAVLRGGKTPPEGGLLPQANQWGHQRRGLHPCAKSLGDPGVHLSGGLQQPLLQDQCSATGRYLWELSEDLPKAIWFGPGALLQQPWHILGCPPQEDWSRAWAVHRLRSASLCREGDVGRHLDGVKEPRRGKNPRVEGYCPKKPNSHIRYLDANNLYGWRMSQPLPAGGFQWVEDCNQLTKTIADHPADDTKVYILEVDLEYPQELHDAHNAYPLAPEHVVVKKDWMSEYQHNLLGVGMVPTEVEKLIPNLRDKDRYVLNYCNLPLYMSLWLHLKKICCALWFKQSPWMEPYIRMNTELCKVANSDFVKDLYKLMNNSVFGKTMGNLHRRVNVKLVRAQEEDKLCQLITSPAFALANIFNENLEAILVHKSRLVLNRPVFVGMSILDLFKHLMYDFYYNQLKRQYRDRYQLLYTNTESLLL